MPTGFFNKQTGAPIDLSADGLPGEFAHAGVQTAMNADPAAVIAVTAGNTMTVTAAPDPMSNIA